MNNSSVQLVQTIVASNWTLVVMVDKTCTAHEPRDTFNVVEKNECSNGKIWEVLTTFEEKSQGDSILDQISLDKDKLTIVMKKKEYLDKQFNQVVQIQARHRHKE